MKGIFCRILGLGLVLSGVLLLAGCEASQQQFVMSWAEEWARSKNIHPRNEDGSINFGAALNLGVRAAGGSTGDPDADAALDAFLVIKTINDADKLMAEGREKGNPAAMDQAINMRPGDWTYRVSRGTLALDQGDVPTCQEQFAEADRIADQRGIDPLWYANQGLDELANVASWPGREGSTDASWQSAAQCRLFNERVAQLFRLRFSVTQDPEDEATAEQYQQLAAQCGN